VLTLDTGLQPHNKRHKKNRLSIRREQELTFTVSPEKIHQTVTESQVFSKAILKYSSGILNPYKLIGKSDLTLSNPIFLPPAYSSALIYFGRERGWWVTCNYPTVLKEKS
jgi:hypothetical protein